MPLFGNNANFGGNQAINMAAEVLGSAPGTAVVGRIYYDSGSGALRVCTNATGPVFTTLGAGPSFATNTITFGSAAAAGSSGSVIRADSTIAAFDTNAATVSAVADAATVGTAAFASRRDHVHGREAFGAPTAQTTFGASSANGTAATLARADHTHGTPTHIGSDHSAISISSLSAPTGDVAWGTHKITGLVDPTGAQDAATKNYVDATAQGLSPKSSVRAATVGTETFTILSGNVTVIAGTTLDGQTPAINDRILVKDAPASTGTGSVNSTQPGNGIYAVTNNTTNLTISRVADMSGSIDLPYGVFVFVEAGTANSTTGWTVSSPTAGTAFVYGTGNIHWVQFSGAGTYSASTGLTLTGSAFSISATYIGQSTITTLGTIGTGVWQGTAVGILYGGTGQTTAALARGTSGLGGGLTAPTSGSGGVVSSAAGGITTKVIATIGDGSTTSVLITHNLGTTDVAVAVYSATTPFAEVIPDVQHTSTNTVTLVFAVAPTASQYKVALVG